MNKISIQFRLHAAGYTAEQLQDSLYDAAHFLINEDVESRESACAWLHQHGFTDLPCFGSKH